MAFCHLQPIIPIIMGNKILQITTSWQARVKSFTCIIPLCTVTSVAHHTGFYTTARVTSQWLSSANIELLFGLFAWMILSTCTLPSLPHVTLLDAFLVLP